MGANLLLFFGYNMKLSDTDINKLNEDIALHFGCVEGRPRYRVVWSGDQFEKRFGTYNEFYGPIFIRETTGVLEVPKYRDIPPRYVLERIFWFNDKELVQAREGIYEAIWHFVDKNNNTLPPIYPVIAKIIRTLEGPVIKRTEKDDLADEEKKKELEVAYFTDYFDDIGQSSLFYKGETGAQGVFIDSTKVKK